MTTPTPIRMLIVEDCDTDYILLERQLQKLLLLVECKRAANHRELIELLPGHWDLIISDYHLTDIEGEELLLLIAQSHIKTPCLLLSGSIEGATPLDALAHVYARLQKGDRAALRSAVLAIVQSLPE